MRSTQSDSLADQLQSAFEKSQMTVLQFINFLSRSRPLFMVNTSAMRGAQPSFHVVIEDEMAHFYFSNNRWHCKF